MGRAKLYGASVRLNLPQSIVDMVTRVCAAREARMGYATPASDVYRDALLRGLNELLGDEAFILERASDPSAPPEYRMEVLNSARHRRDGGMPLPLSLVTRNLQALDAAPPLPPLAPVEQPTAPEVSGETIKVAEGATPPPPERRAEDRPAVGAWARTGDNNRSPAHRVEVETAGGLLRFACGREDDARSWRLAPEDARRCPKCDEGAAR